MASEFTIAGAMGAGVRTLTANPRIVLPYLALAVLLPFLVFGAFPQASMRTFLALALNPGTYLVDGSPLTIASIFFVAAMTMAAMLFACWHALLAQSRDGFVGEIMYGIVASLLSMLVAAGIWLVWTVVCSFTIGIALGFSGAGIDAMTAETVALAGKVALGAILLLSLPMLWLNARLCLSGPAMAAASSINPFAGLARSWQATAHAQWRILLYLLALQIAGTILFVAMFALTTSLIMAGDGTGWHDWAVSALWALFLAISFAMQIAVPTGLWRALNPAIDSEIFA